MESAENFLTSAQILSLNTKNGRRTDAATAQTVKKANSGIQNIA